MKRTLSLICSIMLVSGLAELVSAQYCGCGMNHPAGGAAERITLDGEITNIIFPLATIKSSDREYTVHLGSQEYWQNQNHALKKGPAKMVGVMEDRYGAWHFFPSEITQGETKILLDTDESYPARGTMDIPRYRSGHGHHRHHCGPGCRH